jgi:hypothetical protein
LISRASFDLDSSNPIKIVVKHFDNDYINNIIYPSLKLLNDTLSHLPNIYCGDNFSKHHNFYIVLLIQQNDLIILSISLSIL